MVADHIHSDHTYEASWRQPEDVDRILRQTATGYTLNLCSGESPLGDVQVDSDPRRDPDIIADMANLPFSEAVFDSVVFDPPWKIGYFQRQTPFFEAVRVTKPNGVILMNALWVGESENTRVDGSVFPDNLDGDVLVRADDEWSNISVIVPHRKQPGQSTLGD